MTVGRRFVSTQRSATQRNGAGSRGAWLRQHFSSLRDTLLHIRNNPGGAALGVLVIGVTLALPLTLHVAQQNLATVLTTLGARPQATLYLSLDATLAEAEGVVERLRSDKRVGRTIMIHRDDAVIEFADASNLHGIFQLLDFNPLPHTVIAEFEAFRFEGTQGEQLRNDLHAIPNVSEVQFDVSWIQRLQSISTVTSRAALIVATILGIGVVLITGNTIRLGIHQRREEIEIQKLCGATDTFVRRPFLYYGALQGLLGAFVAVAIVAIAFASLSQPTAQLAQLYNSDLKLENISLISIVFSLLVGAVLGLIGAWIAVTLYLRDLHRRSLS